MRSVGWLLLLTLLACAKPSPKADPTPEPAPTAVPDAPATAATSPTPQAPPKDTPQPPPEPPPSAPPSEDPCAALREQFEAEKKAAPLSCASAADCKCYSSLQFDNTIELADKASARKLQALSDKYRQNECPTVSVSVARPPQCRPKCVDKRCK